MNTYEENLAGTVIDTLADLAQQQGKLDSAKIAANYRLYYAQGAEQTARDKLAHTDDTVKAWRSINEQGRLNENQAFNLLATVTQGNTNVTASSSNMATAAANVQIASHAIVALAAQIGAALNTAGASLYDTNLFEQITDANSLINQAANEAKSISEKAMLATSNTSEIIGQAVLAEATTVKAKIDGVLKATQARLDKFSSLSIAEGNAVGQADIARCQAQGGARDAEVEAAAGQAAYTKVNAYLNQGLTVAVTEARFANGNDPASVTMQAAFSAFPQPQFNARHVHRVDIPLADPLYYLALAPAAKQATLTTDMAEQLFKAAATRPGFQQVWCLPQASDIAHPLPVLSQDVFGKPIEIGDPYVAFVYTVLSINYKSFINNYSDWLSAPSLPFTPALALPRVLNVRQGTADDANPPGNANHVVAYVYGDLAAASVPAGLELRCILLEQPQAAPAPGDVMMASPAFPDAPVYFDPSIALQVSRANYELGTVLPQTSDVVGGALQFRVEFTSASTDNFGNQLQNGRWYLPYILAVVNNDDASQYASVLTPGASTIVPGKQV